MFLRVYRTLTVSRAFNVRQDNADTRSFNIKLPRKDLMTISLAGAIRHRNNPSRRTATVAVTVEVDSRGFIEAGVAILRCRRIASRSSSISPW